MNDIPSDILERANEVLDEMYVAMKGYKNSDIIADGDKIAYLALRCAKAELKVEMLINSAPIGKN